MSGDAQTSPPPPVMWAQRAKSVLLTICLEDCKSPDIKILKDKVYFKGVGGTDKKEYEVTINLYKEIRPAKSVYSVHDRVIEFVLSKKDIGPFWPHLTKEKVKYHWLKVNFDKWQEEDDSDHEMNSLRDISMEDVSSQSQFMKDLEKCKGGGDEKFDMDNTSESDSDDGDLPDLE